MGGGFGEGGEILTQIRPCGRGLAELFLSVFDTFSTNSETFLIWDFFWNLLKKCRKNSKIIPRKFHSQKRAKRMNLPPPEKAIFPNQPSRKKVVTFFLEGVRRRQGYQRQAHNMDNNFASGVSCLKTKSDGVTSPPKRQHSTFALIAVIFEN